MEKVLRIEEENFGRTLERGMAILNDALDAVEGSVLDGETVFKLYDTYGFPADLTNDVARERGFTIDEEGFEAAMEEQRQRARDAGNFGTDYNSLIKVDGETEFCGYSATQQMSPVSALFVDGQEVSALSAGDKAIVVLETTPFYAESGGQCGDAGLLRTASGVFKVDDTQKLGNAIAHYGVMQEGVLASSDHVEALVDEKRRNAISLNHSATHLLHAALRQVLGEHVTQKVHWLEPKICASISLI